MTDERTYPAGVPCWIDTDQPDVDAARHFYAGLFGWTFADAVPPEVPGTYLIASLDGADVAAIGPAEGAKEASWSTYMAVDDADAVAASVREAGGSLDIEPADAGPGGRLAGCVDPRGAHFRLWQPRPAPWRADCQRARQLELQRSAHHGPCRGAVVLRAAVRLGVRRRRGSGR